MPRQMRIEYPGAIYHVMSRGDQREPIFLDEGDRHDFLKTLTEACGKTGFLVHAYCLMKNHFHLVVETPEGNLAAGVRWLLSTYSNRFNHRHKRCGHLFRRSHSGQRSHSGHILTYNISMGQSASHLTILHLTPRDRRRRRMATAWRMPPVF